MEENGKIQDERKAIDATKYIRRAEAMRRDRKYLEDVADNFDSYVDEGK